MVIFRLNFTQLYRDSFFLLLYITNFTIIDNLGKNIINGNPATSIILNSVLCLQAIYLTVVNEILFLQTLFQGRHMNIKFRCFYELFPIILEFS